MTKENLPEEKLLKLIRSKKTDKGRPFSPETDRAKRHFEIYPLLSAVNGILIVALLGLAGFLAYRVLFTPSTATRPDSIVAPKEDLAQAQTKESIIEKKPLEYYRNQFLKRDLFERPLDQVAASASEDLTKRYKLVGIVLGDVPEAIIEDLTTHSTIFVHPGERLDAVEVQKVEEGRVIFLQEGLEIELKQ